MSSAPCQIETMPTGGGSKQIFICIAGTFQLHVSEPMPLITTSFAHVSHTSPPSKRTPQKIPLCSINSPPEIPPFHLISSPLSLSLSLPYFLSVLFLLFMASTNLKQRIKDGPSTPFPTNNTTKREKKMAMAKRGLRSLTTAVSIPLSLTLVTIYFSGATDRYRTLPKPFWFPPLWAVHATSMASSLLMGLSAWLVWAEGGFHKKPTALPLFVAQLALSLIRDPIVFGYGGTRVGLVVCMGLFGALVGCARMFREVNPIAGDLVKPCLAWTAYVGVVTLKLLFA